MRENNTRKSVSCEVSAGISAENETPPFVMGGDKPRGRSDCGPPLPRKPVVCAGSWLQVPWWGELGE